jgi:3-methyladenine DNA glycosylase AlkD
VRATPGRARRPSGRRTGKAAGARGRAAKPTVDAIRAHLRGLADPARAEVSRSFFKTGPGEYGEGDRFLGIRVPDLRKAATAFQETGFREVTRLLASPIHEERLVALLLLVRQFELSDAAGRKRVYEFYLKNTRRVNNWDLVDLSAGEIVGTYLLERSKRPLYRLARSRNLWERRIAIVATHPSIRRGDFEPTLRVATMLLADREDLIHKAVGWMLREVGKRDVAVLERYLREHHAEMPRTALRYAIERFAETKRKRYLKGTV